MSEVVCGHDGLVAVGGVPPPHRLDVPVRARVVDEHVDFRELPQDLPGEALDVGLRGQVERERVDPGVARRADDLLLGCLALGVKGLIITSRIKFRRSEFRMKQNLR